MLRGPFVLTAGITALIAVAASAEDPVFHEEAEVLVVELPVRVTLHGQAVPDLGPQNFEVYDRGERRELSGFEILDRRPQGQPPAADLVAQPWRETRTYLLLFDLAYAGGRSLAAGLAASRELVEHRLQPGDSVAVAFFSALRGLKLLVEPGADRQATDFALDAVEALLSRDVPRAYDLGSRLGLEAPVSPLLATRAELAAEAGILVRADPWWPHRSVIRSFARGLASCTDRYAALPGQRAAILFSQGFDPRFLTGAGSAGTLAELEQAFRSFRRAGWTLDAINVGGLRALGGRDSLFFLAHETGGESFENFNDVGEALDLLLERRSVTYLLSFQADDIEPNGAFHRLTVRLRGAPPGARAVHRPGYYAPERRAPPLDTLRRP